MTRKVERCNQTSQSSGGQQLNCGEVSFPTAPDPPFTPASSEPATLAPEQDRPGPSFIALNRELSTLAAHRCVSHRFTDRTPATVS